MGLLIVAVLIPSVMAQSESNEIPSWIKGVANFWVEGGIDDGEFIEALVFLLENEIIEIPGYGKIIIPEEETKLMALTINTDKETYTIEKKMEVSGTVPNNEGDTIVLLFLSPSDNIVSIKHINSNDSGEYFTSVDIGGDLMIENGSYIIRVQYQGEKIEQAIIFNGN